MKNNKEILYVEKRVLKYFKERIGNKYTNNNLVKKDCFENLRNLAKSQKLNLSKKIDKLEEIFIQCKNSNEDYFSNTLSIKLRKEINSQLNILN
tara:strand:- start:208 stop:489 length:282 start_codon:yes stop_codon:yes gene_type:complete